MSKEYPYYTIQEFSYGKLKNLNNIKYNSIQEVSNYMIGYLNGEWIQKVFPNHQYLVIHHQSQYTKKIVGIIHKSQFIPIDEKD